MSWAADEFGTADFGDRRLVNRLIRVAEAPGGKPSRSETVIFALMQRAQALDWPVDLLIRVQHSRKIAAFRIAAHKDRAACLKRVERALVLILIVSWRIVQLLRPGRACRDLSTTPRFEPAGITAASVLAKKPVAKKAPMLDEVVGRVAMPGGFLARRHDGEPGAKAPWIGMQRIHDFSEGLRHMRQSASREHLTNR